MIWDKPPAADPGGLAVVRPATRWWVWVLVILLTVAVVLASLDAVNTPEPGQVKMLEAIE